MLHAINTDSVAQKVLEFGRRLLMSNNLSTPSQVKIKEQIIEMEKELDILKARAKQDIERYMFRFGNRTRRERFSFINFKNECNYRHYESSLQI